ncbi:MAG: hypothetical protein ACQ9IQ_10615 [Nitrospirales bacterium]|jgi:hypothetical protein
MATPPSNKKTGKKGIRAKKPKLDHIHHVAMPVPNIAMALEW